jgi:hypothetical protein
MKGNHAMTSRLHSRRSLLLAGIVLAATAPWASAAGPLEAKQIYFKPIRVDQKRFESCNVADFNNDGKLDIVAGEFIYLAPDWKAVRIREIKSDINDSGDGYAWDFMDAPLDVDGDGWLDIVTCSWHGQQMEWFRNPGPGGEGFWTMTLVEKNGSYECGDLADVDGDGKANEILPATAHTSWAEVGTLPDGKRGLVVHRIAEAGGDWGTGVGDLNGDGRPDILRPSQWFEAPKDIRKDPWKSHPIAMGNLDPAKSDHTPQILVYDVNADGRNDVVTSSAHGYGIFWYEQTADGGFQQHVIDNTWTQAHSLTLADVDGDGDLDLFTGKRHRAHNGNDPEDDLPPGVYWYELVQKPEVVWKRHVISFNAGIGSGMNIPVVDIDGDGDLDVVVTGKWAGPVIFENQAVRPAK